MKLHTRKCLISENKIRHYRAYMKMYGEMVQDLSQCDEYIAYLLDNDGLDTFEMGLRNLIEKFPKY